MTPTPQGAAPLPEALPTFEQICDILEIGNPTDEECRLIRLGYSAKPASPLQAGEAAVSAAAPAVAPDLQRLHNMLYAAQRQSSFDAMHAAITAARIELSTLMAAPTAPKAGAPTSYIHADVTQAHADGYKLGLAQVDRPAAPQAAALATSDPEGHRQAMVDAQAGAESYPPMPGLASFERWFATQLESAKSDFMESDKLRAQAVWDAASSATAALRARGAVPSDAVVEWRLNHRGYDGRLDPGAWIDGAPSEEQKEDFRVNAPNAVLEFAYAAPAAPMSAQELPMSGDEDESDLGDWQDGATKPALDGTYLREFDVGPGTSEFYEGKWLRDGFFPSDIQNARWRGRAAPQAAQSAAPGVPAQPVTVEAVARVTKRRGELTLDWLVEGGLESMEVGVVLMICGAADLTDKTGAGEVYLAPVAAPVAAQDAEDAALLWSVHVQGPDDLHAMPTRRSALEKANEFNELFGRHKFEEGDPIMRAVVIEWPHSADAHAAALRIKTEATAARAQQQEGGAA